MVQKRPFDNEEIFEVSSKHPRQVEHNNQLVSFSESVFPEDASHMPHTPGESGFIKGYTEGVEKPPTDIITEHPETTKDIETSVPGCISISSRATSNTSEEDFRSEAPVHVPLFPDYCNPERPMRTLAHCGDIYSLLVHYPPRKPVPIGQNHQAEVPVWGLQGANSASDHIDTSEAVLNSDLLVRDEDEKVLMGTCVMPMPDLASAAYDGDKVGDGRTDCRCEDGGSVRCVRQHIMEAREKLRKSLGEERFVELGFCDMGELVVEKWSEEDEQLFRNVVFSNPISLGKNFWDILSIVFPSRTKRDIVSYYFNVFMLQRRAEQNRYDPMNIDSDNDEWQGSDDSGDTEVRMSDEDEDSVVESLVYQDDFDHHQSFEGDWHVLDEDIADEACDIGENVHFGSDRGITNFSETNSTKLLNSCGSNPISQLQDKISWDERGDQEVQEDSCTSSEMGPSSQRNQVKANQVKAGDGNNWQGSFNGLNSGGGGHEYILEPCDAKLWDAGYITCHKNKVDFLPTCSMIEEVFGDGSWDYQARDGESLG